MIMASSVLGWIWRGTRVFGAIVSSPILRDWLPCAASTRSDTSSPGADPALVVTSCLVMMGIAASFHALPGAHGAPGSSWLLRSSTPEREPDSHARAAITVTTLPEANSRPFGDRSTGCNHHVGHACQGRRPSESSHACASRKLVTPEMQHVPSAHLMLLDAHNGDGAHRC